MVEDLAARYRSVPVGVLHDVLGKAGWPHQVLHSDIKAFDGLPPFAGPAYCVRGEQRLQGAGSADIRFDLYRRFKSGSILVIATGGYRASAMFGENVIAALKMRGCQGLVTDGGYRDKEGIARLSMPVRASYVSPASSSGTFAFVELETSIDLPGQTAPTVRINPGDMIVGDGDGVIVVPASGIRTVIEDVEGVIAAEDRTRDMILAGEDAERAYRANERFSHVRPIK